MLKPEPVDQPLKVVLRTDRPDGTTQIGSLLGPKEQLDLEEFLKNNSDIFTWSPEEMPGIDPSIISHSLSVDPDA